ncbi:hypothetical protein COCNU_scaffold005896G000010 [Cocos nucifera]|nr:hypothetical protein [Cocos nucifera]
MVFHDLESRKKVSELQDSLDLEFKKVEDVVLLDDEDIEPVQSTQGDTPNEWKAMKIYYPSREDPECVELTYSDIECLNPESCLSSPIMNFYILGGVVYVGYYFSFCGMRMNIHIASHVRFGFILPSG